MCNWVYKIGKWDNKLGIGYNDTLLNMYLWPTLKTGSFEISSAERLPNPVADKYCRQVLNLVWMPCAETVWSKLKLYGVATIKYPSFASSSINKLPLPPSHSSVRDLMLITDLFKNMCTEKTWKQLPGKQLRNVAMYILHKKLECNSELSRSCTKIYYNIPLFLS
jgi:hypothetical protein